MCSALKPLLDRFGNERDLTIILFTLDETAYSRELAPLAGHYPALRLGPGLVVLRLARRHAALPRAHHRDRRLLQHRSASTTTRGVLFDPARHDVARRVDCGYLAELVVKHLLDEDEAREVARDLAYGLAKKATGSSRRPAGKIREETKEGGMQ
jgi:glucuronate isomerase